MWSCNVRKELPRPSQTQTNTASIGTERPLAYKGISHHERSNSKRRHTSRLATDAHSNQKFTQEANTQSERLPTTHTYPPTDHRDLPRTVPADPTSEEASGRATDRSVLVGPLEARHSFEPLIGSCEAARLLGNIHVKTLQRYARHGKVPGYQIGGHWYFRTSELDAWLQLQINSECQFVR